MCLQVIEAAAIGVAAFEQVPLVFGLEGLGRLRPGLDGTDDGIRLGDRIEQLPGFRHPTAETLEPRCTRFLQRYEARVVRLEEAAAFVPGRQQRRRLVALQEERLQL